jgi:hypothetical protein
MITTKMKKTRSISSWMPLLKWLLFLLASFGMSLIGEAQKKKDDLKIAYEHFWTSYKVTLKKIKLEKDDAKAASLVEDMKKEILPGFGQLIKNTEEWKKEHTTAEKSEMEEWINSNPDATEVGDLQAELMIRAAKTGGILGKTFNEYMRMMASAAKKK